MDNAVIITPLNMIEGHADLKNALVQPSHGTSLGAPEKFERLVLPEVLSTVELLDTFQELGWRQFVAPGFSQE